jgi:hypothetical protein
MGMIARIVHVVGLYVDPSAHAAARVKAGAAARAISPRSV